MDSATIFARLREPFPDHKWRLQNATNKKDQFGNYPTGTRGMFVAYIDVRHVYDRLDEVLGFGNWARHVIAVNPDGSVTGRISLRIDGEWISQEDIGYPGPSDEDPLKGSVSDSYKRAAVGFGIGRYLYEMDKQWVAIDEKGRMLNRSNEPIEEPTVDSPINFQARTQNRNTGDRGEGNRAGQPATSKQLQFISSIARELSLSDESLHLEAQASFGSSIADLNRRDASIFIERLQQRRQQSSRPIAGIGGR